MKVDKKILSELERYRKINSYITEQEVGAAVPPPPPPPAGGAAVPPPPGGAVTPPPAGDQAAAPIDVEADTEVEKIDSTGESEEGGDTEELEITDLVKSQENIEKKQEEYFNNLFSQLTNLEKKLGEMDGILNRLNTIENKIEKYREKTPQEKLELRTYDSYPFNQKLTDFFDDKKVEMEKTGKHDYILTTDDLDDYSENEMKDSFNPPV